MYYLDILWSKRPNISKSQSKWLLFLFWFPLAVLSLSKAKKFVAWEFCVQTFMFMSLSLKLFNQKLHIIKVTFIKTLSYYLSPFTHTWKKNWMANGDWKVNIKSPSLSLFFFFFNSPTREVKFEVWVG